MPVDEDRSALSKYRLEKSEKNLKAAKLLFENELLSESINRSYYCIFHTARGLIAYDRFDSKKHSTIIAYKKALSPSWESSMSLIVFLTSLTEYSTL